MFDTEYNLVSYTFPTSVAIFSSYPLMEKRACMSATRNYYTEAIIRFPAETPSDIFNQYSWISSGNVASDAVKILEVLDENTIDLILHRFGAF